MKKKVVYLTACLVLWASTMTVQADLIWEPYQDPFYVEYADECVYENSTFIANGPDGEVVVYESPISSEQVDVWENGKSAYISFVYEDENGKLWGVYDNGDVAKSGWVMLEHMVQKYDSGAFREEFAEQIVEEELALGEAQAVYFWTYPGSKSNSRMELGENTLSFSRTFTDEEGHKWGYVGYYMGMKNYWVCVDAPLAEFEELYPNGAPARGAVLEGTDIIVVSEQDVKLNTAKTEQEESTPDAEQTLDEIGESNTSENQVPFVVAIVTAVVAVTGGLLALLKRSFHTKK